MADFSLLLNPQKYSSHQFMNLYVYIKIYLPFSELPEIKMERNWKRDSGEDEMKAEGVGKKAGAGDGDIVGKGAGESGGD